ncbi:hypothetical protein ILYODFUR_021661 [Ilyodon furcidens]|uniref:Uncharacterized protein n=1 Tax=Ilyodon furcidens TaxID=33524 RepID=A0ABV0V5R4_9TELE
MLVHNWFVTGFRYISKLRPFVSQTELEMVVYAFVFSYPYYCNSLVIVVIFHFIRDRVAGAAESVETPRRPSSQTHPPAPPGESKVFPGQQPAERHSPSSMSWAIPEPPLSRTCPEHLPREAFRRHPV